ncbi:MAG: hypothetical protein ACOX71_06280 [Lachnospiraceae bacterium]|jgi:DNA-directed RNA polymerase subunit RPC12/RpoP
MGNLQDYKCPACGAGIEFNAGSQEMKCPYCGTELTIEAINDYNEQISDLKSDSIDWDSSSGQEWQPGETEGMRIYSCNSCGGEIVGDENTGATSCPFCGSPVVMSGQFAGDLKPDLIIPFQLDKEAAKQGLEKHLSGKKFVPKAFKDQKHIDEIKGIYVPYWLFDTTVDADILYKATKVRVWSDSRYDYTETSHYLVRRAGEMSFLKIPADGSSTMPDDITESIEPYDVSQAVDFQTAYMSGFLADKYDITAEDNRERINNRVKKSAEDVLESTIHGYTTVTADNASMNYRDSKVYYALYPVWLLSTSWNGQNYLFAMNGQTGKFIGDIPCDKGAYWRYTGILGAILTVIITLILQFIL